MAMVILGAVVVALGLASGTVALEPAVEQPGKVAKKVAEKVVVQSKAKADAPMDAAADLLRAALAESREDRGKLALAAGEAAGMLGAGFTAAERLKAAAGDTVVPLPALIETMEGVERDLRFRPLLQAPVPPGWPAFTPANEVEFKSYPKYRAAFTTRKPMVLRQNRNFWTLFQHISSRDIPMTAPVEMPMSVRDDGRMVEKSMAFLYPDMETGTLGETDDGAVEVVDVEPMSVINIGIRGRATQERMREGYKRVLAYIEANADKYEVVGDPRVMGWNDPSTPDQKCYTEVQVPVRLKNGVATTQPVK
jgi:hypothetical protein